MLPIGFIALWSGSIASIPAGWQLCDGTGGTPDLRDLFIVGAGLHYIVGATGGAETHSHPFTSDGHFHTLAAGFNLAAGGVWSNQTNTKTDTGTTDSVSHLPPYHALCYIMRV